VYIYIYIYVCKYIYIFKMTVGFLTICHTQYTSDNSM